MSTDVKLVAGRPVTGDINTWSRARLPDQLPIEDFVAQLDKLFAYPEVEAVRWHQYTPGFNDGDPCVFSTGEFGVKLTGGDEDGGDYDDGFLSDYYVNEHYSTPDVTYDYKNKHPLAALLDDEFGYRSKIEAFYHAMEDAFGDPGEITATREGFSVEYYDCGH